MEAHIYMEVKLPMVASATDFTYKWCVNMGLEESDAARMALAMDEILTDIVLYAYGNETGYAEIWYQYTFSDIEIIIQEKGEPFDIEKHPYDREKAVKENDFEGASFECVRKMTDHFHFLNCGKEGKEFRLVKQFSSVDIRESHPDYNVLLDSESVKENEDSYLVTPATSEDAEDIAKLIYRSYNYSYSKEDLYFPKRIEKAILHDLKFGTIVRTGSGGPAGYFAVVKSNDSMIGEVAEVVVSPPHRNRGLMKRMMNSLIEMSKKKGLLGLFGKALTIHTYSQKVNEKFGFNSTAIVVTKSQKQKYKGMDFEPADTTSVVIDFLPLSKSWPKPVVLPDTYRDLLIKIYTQFDDRYVDSSGSNNDANKGGATDLDLDIFYEKNSALIVVRNTGATFEESFSRMLLNIEDLNLSSVYVDIPLNEQKVDDIIQWLRTEDFILAGLVPLFHRETDYLRMQRIPRDVDFDRILTHSKIATKIKEVIKNEYYSNKKEKEKA